MWTNDRTAYRNSFAQTWQKYLHDEPLSVQEQEIVAVINMHPEYQKMLTQENETQTNFGLEENPYLHIGLHLALREQVRINLPPGVTEIYTALVTTNGNAHDVEHAMMTCLAKLLWQAQQKGEMPDQAVYLQMLRELT